MKIHLAKYEPERIGGGWTFMRHFAKGMSQYLSNYEEADIYFISSPSMVSREEVSQAKQDGKKLVLRVDNVVRNSRNRNTGMTRMKDFADWSDLLIYQSVFARKLLKPYLDKEGIVILNSTDESLFMPVMQPPEDSYLYSRFNRDETKNFEVARDCFSHIYNRNASATLTIIGQFSPEVIDGNFDFYQGEKFNYLGTINNTESLAQIYRNHKYLIYSYWNDACSNTLIEALMSGCQIQYPASFYKQGSANEITVLYELYGRDYFSIKRMCGEYAAAMEQL